MSVENGLLLIAIKAAGSTAGTVMALVFHPPKTRVEFVTRSVFSTLSGLLFSEPARVDYLHWPDTIQHHLAAAALIALGSWWLWGAAVRILSMWKPK